MNRGETRQLDLSEVLSRFATINRDQRDDDPGRIRYGFDYTSGSLTPRFARYIYFFTGN